MLSAEKTVWSCVKDKNVIENKMMNIQLKQVD